MMTLFPLLLIRMGVFIPILIHFLLLVHKPLLRIINGLLWSLRCLFSDVQWDVLLGQGSSSLPHIIGSASPSLADV
jgi:hypothetical protein